MLDDFPTKHGPEREEKIIQAVRSGRAKYNFVKITSEHKDHKAEFQVFEDALKVDGIRVNVTPETQQAIADLLRCTLPTAKLYDLIWHQCEHRIDPQPRPITSSTAAMIEHSQKIDSELKKIGSPEGLKATVGKTWIIDNGLARKPDRACNHGWHFTKGANYKGIGGNINPSLLKNPETGRYWYMIQARGFHHGPQHVDYSQVCVLVSRQCWVDGEEKDLVDVLRDPELAPLANHDGVLNVLRQPNVKEMLPIVDLPIPPLEPEPDAIWIEDEPMSEEPEPISEEPVTVRVPELTPGPIVPVAPQPIEYPAPSGIWVLIMKIIKTIISFFARK